MLMSSARLANLRGLQLVRVHARDAVLARRVPRIALQRRTVVVLSSDDGAPPPPGEGGPPPGDEQPKAAILVRRFPGLEYTFLLAGFLKIFTIGALVTSAPNEVTRTAFGQMSQYFLLPVGVGMCVLARAIVDNELLDSKRFVAGLIATLVLVYFGLIKLLYVYTPSSSFLRAQARPAPMSRTQAAPNYDRLANRNGFDMRGELDATQAPLYGPSAYDDSDDGPSTSYSRPTSRRAAMLRDKQYDRQIPKGVLGGETDGGADMEEQQQQEEAFSTRRSTRGAGRRVPGRSSGGGAAVNMRKGFGPAGTGS